MGLEHIRKEIEYMRKQISRLRRDILDLQRAGIDATSAEALLARMQDRVDRLCLDREQMLGEERLKGRTYASGKVIRGTPSQRGM